MQKSSRDGCGSAAADVGRRGGGGRRCPLRRARRRGRRMMRSRLLLLGVLGVMGVVMGVEGMRQQRQPQQQDGEGEEEGLQRVDIMVVPHSHSDPGYRKTFVGYYNSEVHKVLSSVTATLPGDDMRRFVWSEASYLQLWMQDEDETRVTPDEKEQFKQLVREGRIEIVNGGWAMHDELINHVETQVRQTELGHNYFRDLLGEETGVPRYGWQIDPFAPSSFTPTLFAQLGYSGAVLNRIPQELKDQMKRDRMLEFIWRGNSALGDSVSELMVHIFDSHYGAPQGFLWEDALCVPVTEDNVRERADAYLDQVLPRADWYRTPALLVPFGQDFRFQNATREFDNMDRLVNYINDPENRARYRRTLKKDISIRYVTLSEYFDQLKKYQEEAAAASSGEDAAAFPVIEGSPFIPLSSDDTSENDAWSGYYTGYAQVKSQGRAAETLLRSAAAARNWQDPRQQEDETQQSMLQQARQSISLFTHHDNIPVTGVAVNTKDTVVRLQRARAALSDVFTSSVQASLARQAPTSDQEQQEQPQQCLEARVARTKPRTDTVYFYENTPLDMNDYVPLTVFNPLPWLDDVIVTVRFGRRDLAVWTTPGSPGSSEIQRPHKVEPDNGFDYVESQGGYVENEDSLWDLTFVANAVPPMGTRTFFASTCYSSPWTNVPWFPFYWCMGQDRGMDQTILGDPSMQLADEQEADEDERRRLSSPEMLQLEQELEIDLREESQAEEEGLRSDSTIEIGNRVYTLEFDPDDGLLGVHVTKSAFARVFRGLNKQAGIDLNLDMPRFGDDEGEEDRVFIPLTETMMVYRGCDDDTVYKFRCTDDPVALKNTLGVTRTAYGTVYSAVTVSYDDDHSVTYRVYHGTPGEAPTELETAIHASWKFGPMNVNENGVVRLSTNLDTTTTTSTSFAAGAFYEDSGYEPQPIGPYNTSRAVGENYKPWSQRVWLRGPLSESNRLRGRSRNDGDDSTVMQLTAMTQEPRGVTSQSSGELEFMVHRRIANVQRGNDQTTVTAALRLMLGPAEFVERLSRRAARATMHDVQLAIGTRLLSPPAPACASMFQAWKSAALATDLRASLFGDDQVIPPLVHVTEWELDDGASASESGIKVMRLQVLNLAGDAADLVPDQTLQPPLTRLDLTKLMPQEFDLTLTDIEQWSPSFGRLQADALRGRMRWNAEADEANADEGKAAIESYCGVTREGVLLLQPKALCSLKMYYSYQDSSQE